MAQKVLINAPIQNNSYFSLHYMVSLEDFHWYLQKIDIYKINLCIYYTYSPGPTDMDTVMESKNVLVNSEYIPVADRVVALMLKTCVDNDVMVSSNSNDILNGILSNLMPSDLEHITVNPCKYRI